MEFPPLNAIIDIISSSRNSYIIIDILIGFKHKFYFIHQNITIWSYKIDNGNGGKLHLCLKQKCLKIKVYEMAEIN